jgi:hypothetical protein
MHLPTGRDKLSGISTNGRRWNLVSDGSKTPLAYVREWPTVYVYLSVISDNIRREIERTDGWYSYSVICLNGWQYIVGDRWCPWLLHPAVMDKSLQNREVLNVYRLITSYLLHTSFFLKLALLGLGVLNTEEQICFFSQNLSAPLSSCSVK